MANAQPDPRIAEFETFKQQFTPAFESCKTFITTEHAKDTTHANNIVVFAPQPGESAATINFLCYLGFGILTQKFTDAAGLKVMSTLIITSILGLFFKYIISNDNRQGADPNRIWFIIKTIKLEGSTYGRCVAVGFAYVCACLISYCGDLLSNIEQGVEAFKNRTVNCAAYLNTVFVPRFITVTKEEVIYLPDQFVNAALNSLHFVAEMIQPVLKKTWTAVHQYLKNYGGYMIGLITENKASSLFRILAAEAFLARYNLKLNRFYKKQLQAFVLAFRHLLPSLTLDLKYIGFDIKAQEFLIKLKNEYPYFIVLGWYLKQDEGDRRIEDDIINRRIARLESKAKQDAQHDYAEWKRNCGSAIGGMIRNSLMVVGKNTQNTPLITRVIKSPAKKLIKRNDGSSLVSPFKSGLSMIGRNNNDNNNNSSILAPSMNPTINTGSRSNQNPNQHTDNEGRRRKRPDDDEGDKESDDEEENGSVHGSEDSTSTYRNDNPLINHFADADLGNE